MKLFDIYRGGQIQTSYKSVAFALIFGAKDRTLTEDEVNIIIEKIKTGLYDKFDATLRE